MNHQLISNSLEWWEKKRIWFNLTVLIFGIWQIFNENPDVFRFNDVICIIIYGIIANVFYSIGILIELLKNCYLNIFLKLVKFRWFFLIFGTIFSITYTFFSIKVYYNGPMFLW